MNNSFLSYSVKLATSLFIFSICNASSGAFTDAYKCTINGTTTFSQTPCSIGVSTPANIPNSEIPAADYQKVVERNKKDAVTLKKLEDARHKDELLRDKEIKTMTAKNAQTANKCATLRAHEKWAKEDLSNASMKTEKKARIKLNRASEKTALACKAN